MSELCLHFPDPAQRDAITAAARAEGVSLEEFILTAAHQRALNVHERSTASPPEAVPGEPRWLQGTYQVSHHY